MEIFRDSLREGIGRSMKKGGLDYLPPELEDFMGMKVADY
jgi:hypothetical protein